MLFRSSLGGMARASYESINEWMRIAINPDMFLTPTQNITDRSFRFPATFAGEIRQIPGVRYTQVVRNARVLYNGNPVMLVSIDIASLRRESYLPAVKGDSETMYRLAAEGKGVIISDNFAELYHVAYNQPLVLNTPTGPLTLPVVGVVRDYSDQKGSILLDHARYVERWNDDSVNAVRLYVDKSVTVEEMRQIGRAHV